MNGHSIYFIASVAAIFLGSLMMVLAMGSPALPRVPLPVPEGRSSPGPTPAPGPPPRHFASLSKRAVLEVAVEAIVAAPEPESSE